MLLRPGLLEPPDGCGRQSAGVLAEQCDQRLLEVSCGECASSARAPLRKTSVSGSAKVPRWVSWKTLVSVTAYHSFGGEVGGFEHPHDTPPYPFMPSPTFADSSAWLG